ncbi:MAG: hypothetical protein MGG11_12330, partial [Trichodesmium sp. MAG_R03]|nr:hypothetical protein [Trichodesmium sp. MAG_R03]
MRYVVAKAPYWTKNVGGVERSETQQRFILVRFRLSTQPALIALLVLLVRYVVAKAPYWTKNVGGVERSETQQ